ncbi:Outer membrane protein assembly factor BamB precursor [Rhodobacteraceae bacterium THAF1]|uniref:outer membrane protein assembly factor BamB family protein n=1 Tax=Palleronia sp. THAF1 TaxID=2587842 RepID=UPI000F3C7550|nr:PQQ-like beta-propeller repeat protein [Palleronia sp. THAF1]QFU09016.1 Outer membrane protein assembly factor BamB precursor [Palleronia sp. THAF1]VDC24237.1 Outer membrane protein assembly factor BamB precursor [Rhodobacteraceae bacterium THAF1]
MTRIGLMMGVALVALAACGDRKLVLTGERLNLQAESTADVNRSAPISLPGAVSLASWTHKGSAPDHSKPHVSFSANPSLVLSVPIGQGEDRKHRITATPVVADGRVFTVDSRARVMAHTTGGQPLWSAQVSPASEPVDDASGAGLAVSGGTLYVSTAFGQLLALDAATGQRRWVQDLGSPASGAPTVSGGTVYVVGRDATAWAIDTTNGRVKWTEQGTPTIAGVSGGASPAVSGDTIVLPFGSRELKGLLPGGTTRWTSNVAGTRLGAVYAGIGDISGDPVISGNTIYAGSPSGRTNAFSLGSGEQLWSAKDGAMSPVAVAGGSVFTVSDQAELVRLDAATGERIWGTELPFFKKNRITRREAVFAHYGPVIAGGRLWVGSSDGVLRSFDPVTGALAGQVELPGGAATNPVIVNQTLYIVSKTGRLLAFR